MEADRIYKFSKWITDIATSCTNIFVHWLLNQLSSLLLGSPRPTSFNSGLASGEATLGGVATSPSSLEALRKWLVYTASPEASYVHQNFHSEPLLSPENQELAWDPQHANTSSAPQQT